MEKTTCAGLCEIMTASIMGNAGYSSVGRASDCRSLQQSDGPWFDSGWPDFCARAHGHAGKAQLSPGSARPHREAHGHARRRQGHPRRRQGHAGRHQGRAGSTRPTLGGARARPGGHAGRRTATPGRARPRQEARGPPQEAPGRVQGAPGIPREHQSRSGEAQRAYK